MQSPSKLIVALALVALPLLELALLIKAGQSFGFWPVVLAVIGTGILGSYIIRTQGIATFRRISEALENDREPHRELADGALRLLAGVLLLLPGPITDSLGALLMISPLRSLAAGLMFAKAAKFGAGVRSSTRRTSGEGSRVRDPGQPDPAASSDGPVIEGEFERIEERTVDPSRFPKHRPPRD